MLTDTTKDHLANLFNCCLRSDSLRNPKPITDVQITLSEFSSAFVKANPPLPLIRECMATLASSRKDSRGEFSKKLSTFGRNLLAWFDFRDAKSHAQKTFHRKAPVTAGRSWNQSTPATDFAPPALDGFSHVPHSRMARNWQTDLSTTRKAYSSWLTRNGDLNSDLDRAIGCDPDSLTVTDYTSLLDRMHLEIQARRGRGFPSRER